MIERLDMLYEGVRIKGNDDILEVSINGGLWHKWQTCSMTNCFTGLSIKSRITAANDSVYEA
ncbi:hypothetical protein R1N_18220 [Enterobacter asburiae]|nr:hypothetical protein R1N_18220 [Enterobacter asburiae]